MRRTVLIALLAVAAAFAELSGSFSAALDRPAIQYDTRPPRDPVAALNREIQAGSVEPRFEGASGYLRSVLEALRIPIESQLLVFSKTSLQGPIITPRSQYARLSSQDRQAIVEILRDTKKDLPPYFD